MRALLDTQTLLWWLDEDRRLGKHTLQTLGNMHNQVYVSSLSIFECAAKERIEKLRVSTRQVVQRLELERFTALDYDFWSAQKLAEIPLQGWKDPFDFGLIAQAAAKNMPLITADQNILDMYWPEFTAIDARR